MKNAWVKRFESREGEAKHEVLLVFYSSRRIIMESALAAIDQELNGHWAPDEILFAVPEPATNDVASALTGSVGDLLLSRLRDRTSITIRGYDVAGKEVSLDPKYGARLAIQVPLTHFCRRGITSIFNSRNGRLRSSSNYHFIHPSGGHTDTFLRASNLLATGPEIGFLAFCCLPHLGAALENVYIDTPGLFSVVSAANDLRRLFEAPPLEVECFRSYSEYRSIQEIDLGHLRVLISASCTGALAQRISSECEISERNITHLLFFGNQQPTGSVVCNLNHDASENPDGLRGWPRNYQQDDCELCKTGSTAIPLQEDTFGFSGPQPEPILIGKSDAPDKLSEKMGRLAGAKIFATGLASGQESGQPDLFVDSRQLTGCTDFSDRLSFVLRSAVPASATYIFQIDDDSRAICELVQEHIAECSGAASIICNAREIEPGTDAAIVVVAVVIESGRSLVNASRDLRAVAPDAPLTYLIGIEKTTGFSPRVSLEKTLIQTKLLLPHRFLSVENIVLPASSSENSWDDELRLWQSWFAETTPEQEDTFVKRRIAQLNASANRTTQDLFLANEPNRSLTLQSGFVFWPKNLESKRFSEADVYFTIASVLQELRSKGEAGKPGSAIQNNWFHQTILAASNFDRFNDDIVQASLLRAATKQELNYSTIAQESKEMAEIMCGVVGASDEPKGGAAAEFMLAFATQRLKLRPADQEKVLEAAAARTGILKLLHEIAKSSFGK